MKKLTFSIIIFVLLFGAVVFAQDAELPDPGLTPDSPFYFLETIAEGISTFFTFGDLKKAERYANLAAERLAEARAVVEKWKPELAEKTLGRYEMQLEKSMARVERAETKGQNTEKVVEVLAKVGKATSKHLEVLAEVYEKVPEEAKPAIENAMKVSVKGHEKAVEVLKAKNALGDVPEEVSLPERIPQEVRERVQMRAQQELQIEKALEGVDTSKSLRGICQDQGGTPEMCEQFPLEKFESFEQIEDYCTELGGQPEVCTTLEDKCKEFGVTTPNECFILLMVSSVSAYQSAEMKVVPAQPWSEEEMEERRIQMEAEETSRRKAAEEKLSSGQLEDLAKCLTEKGAKFYVSENCVHCEKQKEVFGDAARFLPYIDCSDEETRHLCEEAGVGVVPAWDFPGKERALGLQPFEQLAELSGCSPQ